MARPTAVHSIATDELWGRVLGNLAIRAADMGDPCWTWFPAVLLASPLFLSGVVR